MKMRFAVLLIILVFIMPFVVAHEEEQNYEFEQGGVFGLTQLQVASYGALAFGALVVVILLLNKRLDDFAKKIVFALVILVVGLTTIYLVGATLHLNIVSETKGPIHWHADYEIWICGEQLSLPEPKGFSNKQGTDLFHSHNDNRIHAEGVLIEKRQASLRAFFNAVGGSLEDDSVFIPTDNGIVSKHNGDLCNGAPGNLYVFVNGNLISDYPDYIISPYENVPPGDRIKIIFTEQQLEQINPDIG